MNIKVVIEYKIPLYPTKLNVLDDSALLENHLPAAWRSIRGFGAIMAIVLSSSLMSCSGNKGKEISPTATKPTVKRPEIDKKLIERLKLLGALGYATSSSEEDSKQIIKEEKASRFGCDRAK